jgi:hypothetical protein
LRKSLAAWLRGLNGNRFLAAEFFVLLGAASCFAKVQSDTWWHLASGREMVRTGQILLTDHFSHTAYGAPWANYEWLTQWIFFQLYQADGMPLLVATCALSLFGACAMAWTLMRGPLADRLLVFVFAAALMTPSWAVRPQAFSLFLLGLTVHLVVRERHWLLPIVFLAWANLHGAVALGLVVLLADLLVAAGERRGVWRRSLAGVLSLTATLLTPLGATYWPEILRSLERSRLNQIAEWRPPALSADYAVFWLGVMAFAWMVVTRGRRLRIHADRVLVVTALMMLPLAMASMRNMGPMALVMGPAFTRLTWPEASSSRIAVTPSGLGWQLVRACLVGVSAVAAVLFVLHTWTSKPPPADWVPLSEQAAAAIRACPDPLYNHYNDGGYLIWFTPERKVFLDSRQDLYPVSLIQAQIAAERTGDYRSLLSGYSIRCAVVDANSTALSVLEQSGWREDFRDSRWAVLRSPEHEPRQ